MIEAPHTEYYFAYGMNLPMDDMSLRCPDATPVGKIHLPGWQLVFAGPANIIPASPDSYVPGAIWKVTENDIQALDCLEGYPHYYRIERFSVTIEGDPELVFVYVMNHWQPSDCGEHYFNLLERGYLDWGLDAADLYAARAANRVIAEQNYVKA